MPRSPWRLVCTNHWGPCVPAPPVPLKQAAPLGVPGEGAQTESWFDQRRKQGPVPPPSSSVPAPFMSGPGAPASRVRGFMGGGLCPREARAVA